MPVQPLPLRQVGRVPALTLMGYGASQFGNLNRVTSDEASIEAIEAAWTGGVRYFDTAPHYGLGLSERRLGMALRGRPRDEYVLSTKVGRVLVPTPERAGETDADFLVPASHRRHWDFSRDGIRRSLDASLERLGVDRVDIAYLHDPDDWWPEASTTGIEALVELRDEGTVRAIGVGMNQVAMLAEFVRRCDVDLVMVAGRCTLLDQSAVTGLLPVAADRGVAVVAAAVYNSGLLSRSTVPDHALYDYAPADQRLVERARRLAAICASHGVELPAAAAQYPLRHPEVVSVVLGTRTAAQAREGIDRLTSPIPDDLWADLEAEGLLAP